MSNKNVVDFNEKRQKSIEQKRRTFERVVFQDFLGCETVVDDQGSGFPIKFVDISKDGCKLQLPFTLKLFFTKETYLPAVVTIRHASEYVDRDGNAWLQLGGVFDTSLPSYKALASFTEFMYQYAEYSCVDKGEQKVLFF